MPSITVKIKTASTSTGTWRASTMLYTKEGAAPLFRRTSLSDSDTEAEAIGAALTYYGQHMEGLLKALGFTAILDIETRGNA